MNEIADRRAGPAHILEHMAAGEKVRIGTATRRSARAVKGTRAHAVAMMDLIDATRRRNALQLGAPAILALNELAAHPALALVEESAEGAAPAL